MHASKINMRDYGFGFTLIELMVTVAIVAILASIAYPSYRNQIMRSNRTEAKTALLQSAQSLEKCFTQYGSYNNTGCGAVNTFNTEHGYYTIDAKTSVTATTFNISATPLGAQANDTDCVSFTLSNTNAKAASNSGNADTSLSCWK